MIDRLLSVLMAVCLALLVWLYTRSRDHEMLDNVTLPVEVVLAPRYAEHYHLEVTGQAQILTSFTGPVQRIRELQMMMQRKELQVVKTFNVPDERLNESRFTEAVVIEAGDLNAPPGVTPLVKQGHNRVLCTLHRLVERRLPVRFDHLRNNARGCRCCSNRRRCWCAGRRRSSTGRRICRRSRRSCPPGRCTRRPTWRRSAGCRW